MPGFISFVARMVRAKCSAPPSGRSSLSTEVRTTYESPILESVSATFSGSSGSGGLPAGLPGVTMQNLQALEQTSPINIRVAVPLPQHSATLGQWASSQTVCSFSSLKSPLSLW